MDKTNKIEKLEKENQDLIDTIAACLIGAGAPTDIDEQVRVVCEAGNKPSDFIKQEIKKLHSLIWLIQWELKEYIYYLRSYEAIHSFSTNMKYFVHQSFREIMKMDVRKEVEKISEEEWSEREAEEAIKDEQDYYDALERGEFK